MRAKYSYGVIDYQVRKSLTLIIRALICGSLVALLAGAFGVPAQAITDDLTINSLRVTNSSQGQGHTVEIRGTFSTKNAKPNTHLDLVTFGPLQNRTELAQVLSNRHLKRGTVHTEISALLSNPSTSQSNNYVLKFDGDKALSSPADGVYVFGVIKRGSSLQTNYVQPWFYNSKQIEKTNVVFLAQVAVLNQHLADGTSSSINSDALTLSRINNLLDQRIPAFDLVKDPAIEEWLADLQKSALKPAADEVISKLRKATAKSATQIYNHTDMQSLLVSSPNDIWSIMKLSTANAQQPLLYFPRYGQINAQTLAQLPNAGKIIPVLSNTFIGGDPYQTTNAASIVNGQESLIYDAGISHCLSKDDASRAIECVVANTAMITAESPYQGRTVAIVTPPFWQASTGELATIIKALGKSNWSALTTVSKVLRNNNDQPVFNITGIPRQFPKGLVPQGKRLIKRATILGNAVQSQDFTAEFQRVRLRSFTDAFAKRSSAKYFLARNQALLERIRTGISLQTSSRITVATARSEIPLTISNTSGYTVQVRATITSPSNSRFTSTPSDLIAIPNGARVTVPVKIHFKGTGSISVRVRLTNAKNQNLGIIQDISVASSGYQSLARTLVWGACGLLVLFAIVNAARKRRDDSSKTTSET